MLLRLYFRSSISLSLSPEAGVEPTRQYILGSSVCSQNPYGQGDGVEGIEFRLTSDL